MDAAMGSYQVNGDLTFETKLIKILDWGEKVLRNKKGSISKGVMEEL
jgi:hypothetical protein